jgi:hypothetical protein
MLAKRSQPILIEGLRPEEILQLPDEDLAALIAVGPMVFKVGTADVLGQMRLGKDRLNIELAQIVGGGEGVLLTLSRLAEAFARQVVRLHDRPSSDSKLAVDRQAARDPEAVQVAERHHQQTGCNIDPLIRLS